LTRTTARGDAQARAIVLTMTAEERHNLNPTEKGKYYSRVTEGITPKFDLTNYAEGDTQLQTIYSVTMRVAELEQKIRMYAFDDVFGLAKPTRGAPDDPGPRPNILSSYTSMTVEDVRASTRWYRRYGQAWDLESLTWSEEFVKNSCDPVLREKVMEQVSQLDELERGGPTFFIVMIKLITTITEEGVRALTAKVATMKINKYEGENVMTVVSYLRGAIACLQNVNKLPHDIVAQVCDIMQTSSVEEFNKYFEMAKIAIHLQMKTFTVEELLATAQATYQELYNKGVWTNGGNNSAFNARGKQQGERRPRGVCWNCGEAGHMSNQCTKPKKQDGDRNNNNSNNPAPNADRAWTTKPPGSGESHEKEHPTGSGTKWRWCGRCKRWTVGRKMHFTKDHKAKNQNQGQGQGPQTPQQGAPQANVADQPQGQPGGTGPRVSFAESVRFAAGRQSE